jgi:hypothetical protein
VIIYDLDVVSVPAPPAKANTPLIVNPNTVLTHTIAAELFQAIRRRNPKVVYRPGSVKNKQFAQCHALDSTELPGPLPEEHLLGFLAAEPRAHVLIITRPAITVKRY